MNTKQKGNVGLGSAIGYFTKNNNIVSIPLNDSQSYDIIVEIDNKLERVQVKTTTEKTKTDNYIVDLRSTGGNKSRNTVKHFDKKSCDYVYVCILDKMISYLIPSSECNKHSITLYSKFDKYKV